MDLNSLGGRESGWGAVRASRSGLNNSRGWLLAEPTWGSWPESESPQNSFGWVTGLCKCGA